MRQKNLFLVFLILLSCTFGKTYAQITEAAALESISTAAPLKTISVRLMTPLDISNEQIPNSSVILKGTYR